MVNRSIWNNVRNAVRHRPVRAFCLLLLTYLAVSFAVRTLVPPPDAVGLAGSDHPARSVTFYRDDSWLDTNGNRMLEQNLFDGVFQMIAASRELIVLDMFLFNNWQGPVPETHRSLANELTQALIDQQTANPDQLIVVITDPINTVYGGLRSEHLDRLVDADIQLVLTNLVSLQDSNPLWSGIWRFLVRPFGPSEGALLPNPLGPGRVSLRSYFYLMNFKANHRKLLIADQPDGELYGLVSSANPHDGSSAHRNVAISFSGQSVLDLLSGEIALLKMSGADELVEKVQLRLDQWAQTSNPVNSGNLSVRIISESRIHDTVLALVQAAEPGDNIDLVMFYLSDRHIVKALVAAHQRGVEVRVLLDINNDAFGRKKNGVPNRPVAAELVDSGVKVRWCATAGEQCHAKWLAVRKNQSSEAQMHVVLGSANYTRRNLHDFNMETNVHVQMSADHELTAASSDFFEDQWRNRHGRTYSLDYEAFADDSVWLMLQYRFMEWSGLSTF